MALKAFARKYIDFIIGIIIVIAVASFLASIEFFEWWFHMTREYEDWELDEVMNTLIAVLIAGTILAVRRQRTLKKTMEKLEQSRSKIDAYEKQKNMQEKMSALGQLSSGLAHEIGNSLQPILGLSEIIKRKAGKQTEGEKYDEEIEEFSDMIYRNALHMRSLVEKIMLASRGGSENVKHHNTLEALNDTLYFTIELMPTTSEYIIKILDEKFMDTSIKISRTGLIQVLTNLIKNAVHAMDDTGKVIITADKIRLNAQIALAWSVEEGDYACIEVIDTGHGMSEEQAYRAFEPFYTNKEEGEGTGLGLSTSYQIVHDWGGYITIKSAIDEGTTMSVYIPLKNNADLKNEEKETGEEANIRERENAI